jgi:hypothetical protein
MLKTRICPEWSQLTENPIFLYVKQVVFSSTYSFYGILTKITLPILSKSYENPATGFLWINFL